MSALFLLGLLATAFAHPQGDGDHGGHHKKGRGRGRHGGGKYACQLETVETVPRCHLVECNNTWDLCDAKRACIDDALCTGVNFSVLKQWCTHSSCVKPGDNSVPELPNVEALQRKQQAIVDEQNAEDSSESWDMDWDLDSWSSSSSSEDDDREFGPLDFMRCRDEEGSVIYREENRHFKHWLKNNKRCIAISLVVVFVLCCCCLRRKRRRCRFCSRRRRKKCKKGRKCKRSPLDPKAINLSEVWTVPHKPSPLSNEGVQGRVEYTSPGGEKPYKGITAVTMNYEEQESVITTTKVTNVV